MEWHERLFRSLSSSTVVHDGDLSEPFNMQTGVHQGCLLSPMLFLVALDWIMKETTQQGDTGIQCTLTKRLEELDLTDDLVLLAKALLT